MRSGDLRGDRRPGPQEAASRRSTTWPTGGCCRRASWCSASPGATGATATSRRWPTRRRRSTPARPWREEVWARLAGNIKFVGGSFDDDAAFDQLATTLDELRDRTASRATPRSTSRSRRPRSRSCSSSSPAPGWPTTRKSGGWRRVVVEKPFGNDLTSAKALNDARRRRVHPAGRVPHRPLPRQGDGAEHPGAALRQQAVRAGVELASTSTRCRSPWPRTSASAPGPASTTPPAPPATCCRTT